MCPTLEKEGIYLDQEKAQLKSFCVSKTTGLNYLQPHPNHTVELLLLPLYHARSLFFLINNSLKEIPIFGCQSFWESHLLKSPHNGFNRYLVLNSDKLTPQNADFRLHRLFLFNNCYLRNRLVNQISQSRRCYHPCYNLSCPRQKFLQHKEFLHLQHVAMPVSTLHMKIRVPQNNLNLLQS